MPRSRFTAQGYSVAPKSASTHRPAFSLWCCAYSLHRDPTRGRQRYSRPRDKLIRIVEQPLRHAPEGEVNGRALLFVAEGRKGLGFLEGRAVFVINPDVECIVCYHPQHYPVAEYARRAEHRPHCDAAEWSELLAQKLCKAVSGNHPRSSTLSAGARDDAGPICFPELENDAHPHPGPKDRSKGSGKRSFDPAASFCASSSAPIRHE